MYKKARSCNKLLFVMPSFYPEQAAALSPYLIAKELSNMGYKIIIITTTPRPGRTPEHVLQYYNRIRRMFFCEKQDNIYIIRIRNLFHTKHLIGNIINALVFLFLSSLILFFMRIGLILGEQKVRCFKYIFNGSFLGFIHSFPAIIAKILFNAPVVTMREDLFPFNIRHLTRSDTLFRILLNIEKLSYRLYDIVTVHMSCLKKYIKEKFGITNSIIITIPLGHCGAVENFGRFHENKAVKKATTATFVYAGTVGALQVKSLLRFLAITRKANLKTIVVGGGEYFNLLREVFQDFHFFHDFLPRNKLNDIIRQAKVGIACVDPCLGFPVFPSKILYYTLNCLPVIFIGPKESKNCAEIKELAKVLEPNEVNTDNIIDLIKDVQVMLNMNVLEHILKRYKCKVVAQKLDRSVDIYLEF